MIRLPPRSTRTDTLVPDTTRFRSAGRGVSGVESEVAEILVQIPDVDDFRPRRAAQQRERRLLSRRIVDDGHVLVRFQLGHTSIPSLEGAVKGPVSGRENRPRPGVYQFAPARRSEEHTSELQSLMRISYAV